MIYSLSNGIYAIEVSAVGAELITLKKKKNNYLWTKTLPYWQRHAPVLFPIVGKLKNNTYYYDHKSYTLTQHGFVRDSIFELTEENKDSLVFRLTENNNPSYPFQFELFIKYSLDKNGLTTTCTVINKGTKMLPFRFGAHPGFLCPFYEGETLEDYYFEFEEDEILKRTLLENGLLTEKKQLLILENKILPISESLFKDDALVFSGIKSKSVTLKSKSYSLKVSWDTCTWLGLWKQPHAPFVCIEPWWGVADKLLHNGQIIKKTGINLLKPGKKKEFWFGIEIR